MTPVKKSTVKATRPAKAVTKKSAVKTTVTLPATSLPHTKPKKHVKIQTAEGWRRSMVKKHKMSKK